MTQNTTRPDTQAPKMIPLSDLSLSRLNPRQSAPDAEIAALANSIRTIGLMQNLAGIVTLEGRVEIVAGGRRLRALQLNAEGQGGDDPEPLVPVMLAADETEARAWASTENIARQALHPADEIAAYRDMIAAGSAVEDIARAFAVTVRHVKGRLRLAGLADPILAALRAGDITLDLAAAYTVSDDTERQVAVFEQVHGSWNEREHEIRALLTQEAVDEDSRLAKFVGRAAYEAEGGRVHEDLFGEEVYYLDAELLTRLAKDRLAKEAQHYQTEGWKWV
ncbi:MAG: ParB/RepB/Spo0J family partition protein, partial [Pseudomonadota bacterium]